MGTTPDSTNVLASSQTVTTAYASGATSGTLNVGGFDSVLVRVVTSGVSEALDMRLLCDGAVLYRANDDAMEVEEVSFADASSVTSFSFRIETTAMNTLELQFKGASGGGSITGIHVSPEGTDNKTPVGRVLT